MSCTLIQLEQSDEERNPGGAGGVGLDCLYLPLESQANYFISTSVFLSVNGAHNSNYSEGYGVD